jgi:hypothetical protein
LREECRLTVFENRPTTRKVGPKRDEVTGEWILMICTLTQYRSVNHIEKNEMGGVCGTYGNEECYKQGFGWKT